MNSNYFRCGKSFPSTEALIVHLTEHKEKTKTWAAPLLKRIAELNDRGQGGQLAGLELGCHGCGRDVRDDQSVTPNVNLFDLTMMHRADCCEEVENRLAKLRVAVAPVGPISAPVKSAATSSRSMPPATEPPMEIPPTCPTCNKTFRLNFELGRHMKTFHGAKAVKPAEQPDLRSLQQLIDQQGGHRCVWSHKKKTSETRIYICPTVRMVWNSHFIWTEPFLIVSVTCAWD